MCMRAKSPQSCPTLCDPMAHQATLSMGFSRQEYWSGLPCPPPGVLPDPEIKPASLKSLALAGGFFTTSTTWEALHAVGNPARGPQLLSPHSRASEPQLLKPTRLEPVLQ